MDNWIIPRFILWMILLPLSYSQDFVCIQKGESRSIQIDCSYGKAVFIDQANVQKASNDASCTQSDDVTCVLRDVTTEKTRTECFNKTSCVITFHYDDHTCLGYDGALYASVTHRCEPVLTVSGDESLPTADLGAADVNLEGNHIIIMSHNYPSWTRPGDTQCRIDVPPETLVRLDMMDASHNETAYNFIFCLTFGEATNRRCFQRYSPPSTMVLNNTRSINMSIYMNLSLQEHQQEPENKNVFVRFFFYLLALNSRSGFSPLPIRLVCLQEKSEDFGVTGNMQNGSVNPNTTDLDTKNLTTPRLFVGQIQDYNLGALVGGVTAGALILVLFVFTISLVLGTRKSMKRSPTTTIAEQELGYNVHANIMAARKMRAVLENRQNVSTIEQVNTLNAIMETSSDFGTLDSRAPLESNMAYDIANDSAYDSSTEPIRSLENLHIISPPRRTNLKTNENAFFLSLRPHSESTRPVRVQSMHIEQSQFDHQYENHLAIKRSQPPRTRSMHNEQRHEYVNHFATNNRRTNKVPSPPRRNHSHRQSDSALAPRRARSWYNKSNNRGIDHIKPVHPLPDPSTSVYYNTQPQPLMRKSPNRRDLQTIPSAGSAEFNQDEIPRQFTSGDNKYSFHVLGSSLSLNDVQYSHPSLNERPKSLSIQDQPRGLLFFSNTSINAMLQNKKAVPIEDLYAVPQKKKQSTGFFKLSDGESAQADHEA